MGQTICDSKPIPRRIGHVRFTQWTNFIDIFFGLRLQICSCVTSQTRLVGHVRLHRKQFSSNILCTTTYWRSVFMMTGKIHILDSLKIALWNILNFIYNYCSNVHVICYHCWKREDHEFPETIRILVNGQLYENKKNMFKYK